MNKIMNSLGQNARKAILNKIDTRTKNKILKRYALLLDKEKNSIISANQKDIKFAKKKGLKNNLIDRLTIDHKKLVSIKKSIEKIVKIKDPVDCILKKWRRPNGLTISRVSVPIGVLGIIYESRPNVTSDVASLCFKSGNAVILKGGSEAINTNKILANLFRKSLKENKVDQNFIQFINSKDRKIVDYMLSKMKEYIDVIIPRGGKSLVKKTANQFLKNIKSSIAMHNTSTQFADGGEFGFGGEVGISTNTLPPRGPVGLGQLVSYKYEIVSNGKIRK